MVDKIQEKKCSKCKATKPIEDFSKDKQHWSGHKSACKVCASKAFKKWKDDDPEKAKRIYRKHSYKKYGLSEEEALALVENRIGICPICNNLKPLVVDHCHTTGLVRGLICQPCNSVLGYSKDNKLTLANAITYLENHYGR